MNILDRLTLAKAGYKKADIEAMILADEENKINPDETPKPDQQEPEVEVKVDEKSEPSPADQEEPVIDFESKYKEALETIKEKEAVIKRIQQTNIQMDLSGGDNDIDAQRQDSLNALLDL